MLELVVALSLGLLIGAVLGGLGGGGAILTVPALVYLLGQSAQGATAGSLVIVGLTALAGTLSYRRSGRVRWRIGLAFGLVGIPATWVGSLLSHRVAEHVLLLGFSALMVVAALAMLSGGPHAADDTGATDDGGPADAARPADPAGSASPSRGAVVAPTAVRVAAPRLAPTATPVRPPLLATLAVASAAGLLTGFFGVGGGFVIVPALVLVLRMPMQLAVGTSLVIISVNSAAALAARATEVHLDWSVVAPFAMAAMVATGLGKRVADRLPARRLQVAFAALMVLIAGYTAWQSLASR